MSEPTRLRDEGEGPVRALLRHAPKTRGMTPEDKARTRARVGRAAAGIAVGVGSLAWLQGAAIGAGLGVLTVGVAEIAPALLRSAAPGALVSTRAASAPPARIVAPVVTAAPSVTAAPAVPAESADALSPPRPSGVAMEPLPRATAHAAGAPAPSSANVEPPAETDSLAQEAALLERARAALGASPAEALCLTEAHAARFPAGKLGMERELVALDALRRLGRTAEARTRGEALLSRAKGGLYEERIHKLVDGAR